MESDGVRYFGYGANKDVGMMAAIVGRRPEGAPALLRGYELCVQGWDDIPEGAREILSLPWDESFRSYCIRPGDGKVDGMLWVVTPEEYELVGNWEMTGDWYRAVEAEVETESGALTAHTEMVDNPGLRTAEEIFGSDYPTFLNDRDRMLRVAAGARAEFLRIKRQLSR